MDLLRELRQAVQAYLDRQISMSDLYDWWAAHLELLRRSKDDRLGAAERALSRVLFDWQEGDREEAELRPTLKALLEPHPILASGTAPGTTPRNRGEAGG